MAEYKAPLRDMRFVMYDVFNVAEQWSQWPSVRETVDQETADAILEEAAKLASRTIAPLNRSGDEEGCSWNDGQVTTPEGYKDAYQLFAEGGWSGLGGNPVYGGMGMPKVLAAQFDEMVCSASLAFTLYPSLGAGASLAIDAHASDELKEAYLPKMYSGEWAGTMCLTEPHAGTDLGIIRTKAEDNGDGSYAITGTKIFITGGEHDLTDNIIHLVLAKLPDAPSGPKGISLFLVPKFLVNEDGSLGESNKLACGSIEHKMGINASATCVMNFDGAKGYLVGEPNKGLNAMFTMMNYERLFVGIQGLGSSEMSYQNALEYAQDRVQGRSANGAVQKDKAADPLMVHGDIRRMLLNMKALNEGGRAFSTYVAKQLDIAKFSQDEHEKEKASALVALLTPVVKAFLTDAGLESCVAGQQVFGGHGFIREWGQEQLVRDVRITQIYEGTNGIQALDLLGRKIALSGGAYLETFLSEIRNSVHSDDEFADELLSSVDKLEELTRKLLAQSKNDPNVINSACVDYLNAFAYVAYGWIWSLMSKTAGRKLAEGSEDSSWLEAKQITARYYFKRILPRYESAAAAALSGTDELFSLSPDQF
ncbi:acyl-CoA dehydrogenase C-terminal domain-containing protein [Endozoicomonas elysicola]|uniref:3-methylmercaptopropionyl-CoA dehydrogenase n=1 Tax=Endozoicomonas elysicola TaxID=305900 RepID=A0A081K7B7_9GAMM|nr:acyl-CoA dehydrogenase C-terminal domain-containing protein [Endozoicomonas elysicola]KEI70043.1 acyl-CoA dehydrogenase [Endozoicomonas elysicola]